MFDTGKIIAGLVIFVALVTFPIWGSLGGNAEKPKLVMPTNAEQCVESVEFMRANHMQLLDSWRHDVVRNGNRTYVSENGTEFDMSLSATDKKSCTSCHTNKKEFCDACHDYASVKPYCWECHVEPKENI